MSEQQQYSEIQEQIGEEMKEEQYDLEDTKITHVENLFIISYLTKAIQDLLIRRMPFFQYPLLLVDLPLAFAIFIVNVERILYVKILGYVLAHIHYDVSVLKSLVFREDKEEASEGWQGKVFDAIRKFFRFLWGFAILMFILPVWPLIWVYNYIAQTILIAVIYYFLMFYEYSFFGGFIVYYFLLVTVTFLVSSITVPFIFQLTVYIKAIFSLEKKTWKQVHKEAKMAFVKFYQRLHGSQARAMKQIKTQYDDNFKAEGGVYYMLLKFLHYFKNKFWTLKERKMDAVVGKIQNKTMEYVDDYYEGKNSYYFALQSLSAKDLKRTVIALAITIVFSLTLVFEGSHGKGLIGPILVSFVDQTASQQTWINYEGTGRGYYEDMVAFYAILPNILRYIAIAADSVLDFFFQAYYWASPLYLEALGIYYRAYMGLILSAVFYE